MVDLASLAQHGTLEAMLAVESLARLDGRGATGVLIDLLAHDDSLVRRHAAWRLLHREPECRAYRPLLDLLVVGGIDTMHAHRTLRSWSRVDADGVIDLLLGRLERESDPAVRARLIDLVGVVPSPRVLQPLVAVATADDETTPARIAAVGALGERDGPRIGVVLASLATHDDEIGTHAALALEALAPPATSNRVRSATGLSIVQLSLAAGLDGQLSSGGRGDTGGVASLLVSLGAAFARRPDVERVLTVGRGTVTDVLTGPVSSSGASLAYGAMAVGDAARPAGTSDGVWEHLPAIERNIRRILRHAGSVDVLHLRMADAVTLAGAGVARSLGIPVRFSLAPDPHNVIWSLQARGEMNRESFVRLDDDAHVWFRARLVEQLAAEADSVALFLRSDPARVADEQYGVPPRWPTAIAPDGQQMAQLVAHADRVIAAFTRRWNDALSTMSRSAGPIDDAFRVHGHRVLYNIVPALQDPARTPWCRARTGSSARSCATKLCLER